MSVSPYDEQAIGAHDKIIRRIHPKEHVVWDENKSCYRISSKAYNKSSALTEGMSVDIEKLIMQANLEPKAFVTSPKYTCSVWFFAKDIRALDLQIGYDPEPFNPYHVQVWSRTPVKKFNDKQKTQLASLAQWYVSSPGVQLN